VSALGKIGLITLKYPKTVNSTISHGTRYVGLKATLTRKSFSTTICGREIFALIGR
jgi:hypothetical protein